MSAACQCHGPPCPVWDLEGTPGRVRQESHGTKDLRGEQGRWGRIRSTGPCLLYESCHACLCMCSRSRLTHMPNSEIGLVLSCPVLSLSYPTSACSSLSICKQLRGLENVGCIREYQGKAYWRSEKMLERKLLAVSRKNPKIIFVYTMVNSLCDDRGRYRRRNLKRAAV